MREPNVHLAVIALAAAAALAAACGADDGGGGDTADAPGAEIDAPAADAGDARADADGPASTVRAFRAEAPEELPDGPVTLAAPGRAWVLENAHARWAIQDVGASAGYQLYGGNPVAGATAEGESVLRETFPVIDWRVLAPDAVEVVDDGASGERALIRFTGRLEPTGIIALLDGFAGGADVEVSVEYEVRPGAPALIMRTRITNPGAAPTGVMVGDFIVFGNQLDMVDPQRGFGGDGSVGDVPWIGARGERASYAYHRPGHTVNVPFVANAGTLVMIDTDLAIAPGETVAIERHVYVADGALEDALAPLLEARDVATGAVEGHVEGPAGDAVADLWVTALPVEGADGPPTHAYNQARADAEGRWRLTLPPGDYDLIASGSERRPSAPTRVTVEADGAHDATLTVEDTVAITIAAGGDGVVPRGSDTLPVQVAMRPVDGTEDTVDRRLGDRSRVGGWRLEFAGPGHEVLHVAPGTWDVVVSHGFEHERAALGALALTEDTTLAPTLARTLDTDGWLGCDFHQHTIGSLDSRAGFEERVRENLSAALPCFATTEHDHVVDLGPHVAAAGAEDAMFSVVGNEVSVNGVGHFQAFPLPLDPSDPLALSGAQLWAWMSIERLFERLRGIEGERVLQVNHPRANALKGYFSHLRVDPIAFAAQRGDGLATDFDAVEVNASIGQPDDYTLDGWRARRDGAPDDVPVMMDWFGMLNAGLPVCAVGNSDCHDPGSGCGYPRTYLRLGDAATPHSASDDAITDAIKRQHAVIARGMWLEVTANGQDAMGHLEPIDGALGVQITATARTPQWLSVARLELYENGLHVDSWTPPEGGPTEATTTFERAPAIDSWYVVVARGAGSPEPVFRGAPLAVANPIYADVDGEDFTAPGPVLLD